MDEYKKYKDADNLFSKIYYIDWYDGGVTGILKLRIRNTGTCLILLFLSQMKRCAFFH